MQEPSQFLKRLDTQTYPWATSLKQEVSHGIKDHDLRNGNSDLENGSIDLEIFNSEIMQRSAKML